jgi:uncharacterized protein YdaU (DUF1376 family)
MNSPPCRLWTDAYLGDTTHLNVTQHGAYLLLLMTAWRSRDCALPDDDKLLARYARCTAPQWRALRPSAAEPPQLAHDPVKELFELGVAILVEGGATDKRARSLLGKWRKAKKNDGDVLAALLECRAKAISDPVEWLEKRLASARYVSATGYEYRGDDEAVLREAERRNDMDTYWRAKGAIQRRASVG